MKNIGENAGTKDTEILIAEDSPTQAAQIKHMLESNNFKVTVANDGKEAIDILSKRKPSLVISDILMPEMNGYELCKLIKSDKSTENIPVILLTRLSDPEEIIEGLSCGADSFITKPYNEEFLLSYIERLLSGQYLNDKVKVPFGTHILFKGKKRLIHLDQQSVINLMLSIYEGAVQQNEKLLQTQEELRLLNEKLDAIVEERTADLKEEIKISNKIAEKLKESEERLKILFEYAPDAYYLSDLKGNFIDGNIAAEKLMGYNRNELIGMSFLKFNLLSLKQIPRAAKLLVKNSLGRATGPDEFVLNRRDGIKITVEILTHPVKIKNQTLVLGIARDITERKRAEEALRESEEKYRLLVNTANESIIVAQDGLLKFVNNITIELLEVTSEQELIGRPFPEFIHPDDQLMVVENYRRRIANEGPQQRYTFRVITHKGIIKWVEINATLFEWQGRPATLNFLSDITERKHAEEELIKAKDKAEEGDRLKTAFLHNISHEIRTPMNAIVGFSALLGEPDIDTQSRKDYIEVIMQSSNHLLAIISDIVDISNIEANLVKIEKNKTNVNSTLQSLCDQFIPKTNEKKIKLVCETALSDSDALVLTDSTKLNQILINLINNAIKFTDKGYVKVGCVLTDKFLEFSVSDTGIGIPAEYHAKIFNRFYQVQHSVSRLYEGTGLGLAISKAYTDHMGGKIWFTSEPGKGSSFYFTVPYEKLVMETRIADEKSVAEGFVFPVKKTILVAEDMDSNFKLIKYFLSEVNINLIRAVNGKEAVEKCLSNKNIDLILMDIKMPVMDGYTAVKLIREKNSAIPIIAQTAYIDDKEQALEFGCSGFISKPFDKKGLLKVLQEFI
jgi:PAS domain S-box-containing protein